MNEQMKKTFADHPMVGEVRGAGLLTGIEFVADKTKKIRFEPKHKIGIRVSAAWAADCLNLARRLPHGPSLATSTNSLP